MRRRNGRRLLRLASGAVTVVSVPGRFHRNIPDPVPVAILARLGVDQAYQGRGLGRAMFGGAARRVAQVPDAIGIRGILVHAISDEARTFYLASASIRALMSP